MTFQSDQERNAFIESYLRFVGSRVMRLWDKFDEDLYQTGCIGLIMAIDRFDETKNFKFSTFAARYIDGYILTHMNSEGVIKPYRNNLGDRKGYLRKIVVPIDSPIFNTTNDEELTWFDVSASTDDVIDAAVGQVRYEQFLSRLTKKQRVLIELLVAHKYRTEAAKEIGISKRKVYEMLARIRKKAEKFRKE